MNPLRTLGTGSFFKTRMKAEQQLAAVKKLMQIPGIGRTEADSLVVLGITEVRHLQGLDAEQLYRRLNREAGMDHDKSLIATLHKAILFANSQA